MKIDLSNRQTLCRPRKRSIVALARAIMQRVGRLDLRTRWDEISIVLTADAEISDLNRRYLNNPDITDVISFKYERVCETGVVCDAEVIVNAERAIAEGPRRNGIPREMALYIAHGCNHLLDEKDDTVKQRERMRRRELRWLKDASERGLLRDLIAGVEDAKGKRAS